MAREDNLKPFTSENAAENGRKGGLNKKGSVHLSTLIGEVLENIDWDKTPVKNTAEFKSKYGNNGWKAIVSVAAGQAATGDRHAREWLRKAQYGDKLKLEYEDPREAILKQYMDKKHVGKAPEAPSGSPEDSA